MVERKLVRLDSSGRPARYYAVVSASNAEEGSIRSLASRIFGGSAKRLVMSALGAHRFSPAELAEIRKHIDELKKRS